MKEAQINMHLKYFDSAWRVGLGMGQNHEGTKTEVAAGLWEFQHYNCNLYLFKFFCFLCLELLCDCAELCKCCRLTDCVYSQCESGDYGFSVQSTPEK